MTAAQAMRLQALTLGASVASWPQTRPLTTTIDGVDTPLGRPIADVEPLTSSELDTRPSEPPESS